MKLLKIDLNVPFWCSFSEYGTINIQQTYPFPPPPTIFGMILNAMGKPAPHTIKDDHVKNALVKEYLDAYSRLNFSIVVRDSGEKIDDYLNILKGNREQNTSRSALKDKLSSEKKRLIKDLKEKNKNISEEEIEKKVEEYSEDFWKKEIEKYGQYRIDKKWMRTQINRQRLVQPKYTVYIHSTVESGEYSLESIFSFLRKPKRPLYLGDSDSLVDIRIEGDGIVEAKGQIYSSSKISSVLPGIYQNSRLVMIPVKLRYDLSEKQKLVCSIPNSDIGEKVSCISVGGEQIVFFQSFSKK